MKKKPPSKSGVKMLRAWIIRLALIFLVPLFLIGSVEVFFRLINYGNPVSFFVPSPEVEGKLVENSKFPWRFLPEKLARAPQPTSIMDRKPSGTTRVFVFGESAAEGDPEPAFSMSRILEVLLEGKFPGRDFEVVNVAITALNSHAILPVAKECAKLDGDFWILYIGHNEVMGPFGAGTVFGEKTPPLSALRTSLWLKEFRFGQWIADLNVPKGSLDHGRWRGMEMFLDQKLDAGSSKLEWVYSSFRENMKDIVSEGVDAGVQIVVASAASNLRDSAPFASLGTGVGKSANETFAHARSLEAAGSINEARNYYHQALDLDALRFRADSKINTITRKIGEAGGKNVVFFDAQAELDVLAEAGVSGSDYFFEHVHLTFKGNYQLALLFAERISKKLVSSGFIPKENWLGLDVCKRELAYTNWDRRLIFGIIERRLMQPPFNNRSNNNEVLNRFRNEAKNLSKVINKADDLKIYNQALKVRPADWRLWHRQALLLSSMGRLAEALDSMQKAVEKTPWSRVLHYQYAAMLNQSGRYDDAANAATRAILLKRDFPEATHQLASARAGQGSIEQAAKLFAESLVLDPRMGDAWLDWGRMLERRKKTNEAVVVYRDALRSLPNSARIHYRLGMSQKSTGLSDDALNSFNRAVSIDANFAEAHFQIGVCFVGEQLFEKAVESFQKAIIAKPALTQARFNLGAGLLKLERYKEAVPHFERLVSEQPQDKQVKQYLEYSKSKIK